MIGSSITSLLDRTTSSIPISIGTSLSLESIFKGPLPYYDSSRVIPVHIDISKYDEIWINLSTLIRNISSSVPKEVFVNASPKEIKEALVFEIDVINDLFNIEGKGLCRPMFYTCTYTSLMNKYKDGRVKFRQDKTDGQKIYKHKHDESLKLLNKETDEVRNFNSHVNSELKTSSLIMTHIPYDLVSYKNFSKLDLLESHTGKLKTRHQWYTKYASIGDEDLSMLPFYEILLLILGDHVLIHPNDIRLRRVIVDVAKKGSWTTTTTLPKMMLDFEMHIKEPYVLTYIKSL